MAGLPAPVARSLVRLFRGGIFVQDMADTLLSRNGIDNGDATFARMEEAGYLARVDLGGDGYTWWEATTSGNALAMASFGQPIRRTTADRLVTGLVGRARRYNADPAKPLYVERLRIFGSYLDPAVDPLGDVDIELSFDRRIRDQEELSAYTRASGKKFRSFMAELLWPQTELVQHLKNRSTAINITLENIDHITEQSLTIYTIADDSAAVPPPKKKPAEAFQTVRVAPRRHCITPPRPLSGEAPVK